MNDFGLSRDTICAISTPPGVGGIAVARISGPDAFAVANKIWRGRSPIASLTPRTATLGAIVDTRGERLDQAVVTTFVAPASFTGENTVEIAVHGSRWVQTELIHALINAGARLAEPGEFTRRAFAAGRLDLTQAEAVADILDANSRAAHRLAMSQMRGYLSKSLGKLRAKLIDLASLLELELDFSEEDVEFASREKMYTLATDILRRIRTLTDTFATGNAIRQGIPVAIVGATNVGKSSLLNALVGDDRAIVSDIHGTTRDIVEDTATIGDYTYRFIDTAGLRHTTDPIEALGIDRTHRAMQGATVILLVLDATAPVDPAIVESAVSTVLSAPTDVRLIVAVNKTDLAPAQPIVEQLTPLLVPLRQAAIAPHTIPISALTGKGLDTLRRALRPITDNTNPDLIITNARHYQALTHAAEALNRVTAALAPTGMPEAIPGQTPHYTTPGELPSSVAPGLTPDLIALDLRQAIHHLGEVTGEITPTEILNTIFSRFCIGK